MPGAAAREGANGGAGGDTGAGWTITADPTARSEASPVRLAGPGTAGPHGLRVVTLAA